MNSWLAYSFFRFCPMCSGGFGTHFLPYQRAPLSVLLSLALRPLLLLFFHPISQSHPQQLPPLLTSLLTSPFVFSKAPPTTDGQPRWPIKQLLRMATVTGFTIWSVCWGVLNVPVHECMKCYNVRKCNEFLIHYMCRGVWLTVSCASVSQHYVWVRNCCRKPRTKASPKD